MEQKQAVFNISCINFAREVSLPNIQDVLNQLSKPRYFSTLDLTTGYHQVLVNDSDKFKTALQTYDIMILTEFGLKTNHFSKNYDL